MIAPIRWTLIKKGYKLIFGHSPQPLTTEIIRMHHPQDMEHLKYNIRSDHNAHTSNASNKERYQIINYMHVGVELLYKHGWISDRDITQ